MKCPECGHLVSLHGSDGCEEDTGVSLCGCSFICVSSKLKRHVDPSVLAPFLSFQGGKARIGPELAEMIERHRKKGQKYIEPFVGGASVVCHIGDHGQRIASDAHELLIDFYLALQAGWWPDPPQPTETEWKQYKKRWKDETDFSSLTLKERAQVVWVGYAASYEGYWFKSFRDDVSTKYLDRDLEGILGVDFECCGYEKHSNIRGALIYCDPPYEECEGYEAVGGDFDHKAFWKWCGRMAARGNTVLVSEATLSHKRYIKSTEGYMSGPHLDRQEYLILVKASRG